MHKHFEKLQDEKWREELIVTNLELRQLIKLLKIVIDE